MKRIINLLFISILFLVTPLFTSAYSTIENNKLMIIVEDNVLMDQEFLTSNSTYHNLLTYSEIKHNNIKNYDAYAVSVNLLKTDNSLRKFVRDLYNNYSMVYLYGESISNEDINELLNVEEFTSDVTVYDVDEEISSIAPISIEINSIFNIISLSKYRDDNLIASVNIETTPFSLDSEYIKIIIKDYIEITQKSKTTTLGYDLVKEGYNIRSYYGENYYNLNYVLYKSHNTFSGNDYFGLLTYVSSYTSKNHIKCYQFLVKHDFIQTNSHMIDAQPASIVHATLLSCQVSLNGPIVGYVYSVSGIPNIDRYYNLSENKVEWVVSESMSGSFLNDSYFILGSSHSSPNLLAEAKFKLGLRGMFVTLWGLGDILVTALTEVTIKYRYCDLSYTNPISHGFAPYTYTHSYHKKTCTHCPYYIQEPHTWVHTSYQSYCVVCGYVAPIIINRFEEKE